MQIPGYKVIKQIGSGGMAVVYLAEHEKLGTKVAVKVLSDVLSSNPTVRARFIQEARLMVGLRHSGIVTVTDYIETDDCLAIVMDYVDGKNLDETIGSDVGPIPFDKALPIFERVLEAVDYAHFKGVIHRDLKPSNILISRDGDVKVADFGIAKIAGQQGLTKTGVQMGTIYYESPEQITGAATIDQRADIYSLGITLFEMLAGRLPFDEKRITSEYQIMNAIVKREGEFDPRVFYPHVPEWLVKVVQKATALDVEERYRSCSEFKVALNASGQSFRRNLHSDDFGFDATVKLPKSKNPVRNSVGSHQEKTRNVFLLYVLPVVGLAVLVIVLMSLSNSGGEGQGGSAIVAESDSNQQVHPCPLCSMEFASESARDNHIVTEHGRFRESNGIVSDYITDLQWRVGPDRHMNWHEASDWISTLGGAWRMPTLDELEQLHSAGISVNSWGLFENSGYGVWSSELRDAVSAWFFNFPDGTRQIRPLDHPDYKVVFAVR